MSVLQEEGRTMILTTKEKIGFSLGDMAVNIVIIAMQLIIAYFYTDIFGLKPEHMGLLFLIVRFIDAFTDPVMGMITDKVRSKHGHYRPFLLWLAVPFGIAVYLTFMTPDFSYQGKVIWAYCTYIFITLMFTAVTIPYVSLIGVITDNPEERLKANGYRFVLVKVAAFLVTVAVPLMAESIGGGDLALGYQRAMGIMAVLGTISLLVCFSTTKERIKPEVSNEPIKTQFKYLVKNDQWVLLCLALNFIMVGTVIRGSVTPYYAKYFLDGGDSLISPILTTGVVASLLAMIATTWAVKFVCKIKLIVWSQIATAVLAVLMYFFVDGSSLPLAFAFIFCLWFCADMYLPIFWASIAEAVDYGEVKTGKRVSGLSFGGICFFQKFGMGIAGWILGMLLAYFGYQADVVQTAKSLLGINLMVTLIPGAICLVVAFIMSKYIITNDYYNSIAKKIKRVEVNSEDEAGKRQTELA
ncbi:MFS transporter [Photobacterium satsumensis]|uniref:MFS transporter n=1 Tax=Photobacterium satsumensis TaxID=2910239 RepID=UPI003D123FD6